MKKIFTFFIMAFLLGSFTSFGQVIISQMYEGSSYNKYIEITNMGTSAVNLASPQLYLKLYSNSTAIGVNANYTKTLSGTLNAGQSYLYRYKSSNGASAAINPAYAIAYTPGDTAGACNFNGKGSSSNPTASTDIIALYSGTTLADVFSWGTFQYENKSYIRNTAITTPNPVFNVADWVFFDTLAVYNALAGTPERLGYHMGGGPTTPTIGISSPANGATVYTANVNIGYSLSNFTMPADGHIHYTLDAGAAVDYSGTSPIALTGLTSGSHKVVLTLVDPSHVALVPKAADSVTFIVNLNPPTKTIQQIQYTTLPTGDSPFMDSLVVTKGIVTASFASGYFIQDGTGPWNGLYVYDNTHTPALGDSILIGGTITEYFNLTELKTINIYSTLASGRPLPVPVGLTTSTVKSEPYEGMLVKITDAKCKYVNTSGWWSVQQGIDTCEIGKLMYTYPNPVPGIHYNITGCVYFTFGQFAVEPRNVGDIQAYMVADAGSDKTISCGGNAQLDNVSYNYDGAGTITYAWTPVTGLNAGNIQNPIATVTTSTKYLVTVSSSDGFLAKDSVWVYMTPLATPQICYVEFDTISYKNRINWTTNLSASVDFVVIMSEVSPNIWSVIGTVPGTVSSNIDNFSDPLNQSHRYKIRLIDTCGTQTDSSAFHETVKLSGIYNQGNNTYEFTWTPYAGLSIANYYFYGVDASGVKTQLASVPGTQYSYNYVNPDLAYEKYYVGFITPNCTSKTDHLVLSNYVQSTLTGIADNEDINNLITIYPNPVSDNIQIHTALQVTNIEITDLTGRLIYKTNVKNINCIGLANGVYFLRVETTNGIGVKKFIKE